MGCDISILSKHNLNITNVETLAIDLADRLNLNIDYGYYATKEYSNLLGVDFQNELIELGSIRKTKADARYLLVDENFQKKQLYEKYGVRRYGFHGTSHRYVSKRVCEFLGVNPVGQKIITCHIGNGGSIAAIKDGKCMDTTMGLTPLEGLMMGTRSGDIDAGAVTFIMEKEGLNTTGVSNLLNKKSGVLGISGVSSDMRELLAACAAGNEKAILAEKMYYYRIKKYIGAYAAALGGVDIILFTGGVGENQMECRREVCKDMEFMGIELDNEVNAKVRGEEAIISTPASKVKVVVIPTDEELLIASDTMDILNK